MGSTLEARRAGRNPAISVTAKIATVAIRIVIGSCGESPKSWLFRSRVPIHASGNQTATPAMTTNNVSRSTMFWIASRGAPSAMRMPISLVRRETV
jgi:hypothetical protein